ncbi:MAG TPA: hypothetical protein VK943_04265 [Arenibaculum sp.]|nr:hypothetical protein [Arenibaculum sp.]
MIPRNSLAAAAALALAAVGATAAVPTGHDPAPAGSALVPDGPVRLECWQDGTKIIERTDLAGPALGPAGTDGTIRFGRNDPDGPEAILVTSAATACLITR